MVNHSSVVMAGLVPAIHVLLLAREKKGVDARDKRGHDAVCIDSGRYPSAPRVRKMARRAADKPRFGNAPSIGS
jgi:hypothetical protein